MRKIVKKIWFPVIILSMGAVQTFGIDAGRASLIFRADNSLLFSSGLSASDSIPLSGHDTLTDIHASAQGNDTTASIQDSLRQQNDTIIPAADTIVVPDSLKYTDPFKYKYYIALKDSVTRSRLRDSLFIAGDTLEVERFDSLFVKDSTEEARRAFELWYASLSRKERRKYHYEQELPIKMAKMDSILHVKDSLRAVKDSIIENTPRILETYAVPDSMQYKRLIMWDHDRYFQNLRLMTQDTSYNYHFHEYPFFKEDVNVTYLGVIGSPVQNYNFFRQTETENAIFYSPYQIYNYTPENLPMFNTKTPYTELAYWGTLFANTEKEESNIKILTTQNILPELNVTLEYHRFGGNGILKKEDTDNRTFVAAANYLGKRYLMHAGYIYNKVEKSENGGVIDNFWIRDTTVDAREIEVNLSDASNKIKKNTVFLDQSYRIPFTFISRIGQRKERKKAEAERDSILAARNRIMASGDSVAIAEMTADGQFDIPEIPGSTMPADTMVTDITTAFIGHSSEYSVFIKNYNDNISDDAGRDFYNNIFYINPTTSADSMRVMKLENRIFMRLQPWSDDGIVSKLDVGVGDKLLNYYDFNKDSYLTSSKNTVLNSAYLYAGAQGQLKKYFKWDATGRYTFLGHEMNDFGLDANIGFSIYPFRKEKSSPLQFDAHFETNLKEPDHYQQVFYSNHYKWNNDFGKISDTRIEASLKIPRWKLEASFGYALLSNNIYYDTLGIVRQNTKPMSVMTASVMKNFKLWNFHFDHRALFQLSSNSDVMPLPTLALNLRYYFQFNVVKRVMQMQIGANATYTTKWYAPSYNPVLGVFHNQTEEKYGNCPYIDVFVNIQWKRACIFVKLVNAGMGWPNDSADYFSAHHYIRPQQAFKFGIFWPFYIQAKQNAGIGGSNSAKGMKN